MIQKLAKTIFYTVTLCFAITVTYAQQYKPLPLIGLKQALDNLGGPTLITMHLKDATPQQFYEELWKKADLPAVAKDDIWNAQTPLVTIDANREPFWEVIHKFALQTGIGIAESNGSGLTGYLHPSPDWSGIAGMSYSKGPLYMTIPYIKTDSKRYSHFVYNHEKTTVIDNTKISLLFFTDPKVFLLSNNSTSKLVIQKATTKQGASLIGNKPYETFLSYFHNMHLAWKSISLKTPMPKSDEIEDFKGYAIAGVATKTELWEIPDITSSDHSTLIKSIGSEGADSTLITRCEVTSVIPQKDGYFVKLDVSRPYLPEYDRNISYTVFGNIRAYNKSGKELVLWNYDGEVHEKSIHNTQHYSTHIFIQCDREKSSSGSIKMTWKIPIECHRIKFPFEFHNITLP